MLDTSGHGSGNSTPRRPNPVVVLTPPPYKPKELLQPVDTSSQVSTLDDAKMTEASLEGVPTTISPIAVTTRSRSITLPADAAELQDNANKALEELLATKSSIDARRWRAVWELGMELCQNESKTTKSIKEARAVCSHVTLDAKALCFATIKEAKTTQACTIQEDEAACSVAIRDAETQRASQAELLHRQHGKVMQDLEEQVIQKEGRSQTDFLSACQTALHASPVELKGVLVASYHILLGQAPTSHPFTLSQRTSPVGEQSAPAAPPPPVPKQSPRTKRWHSSPDPADNMPLGGTTSKATSEGPPSPKQQEVPPWNKALKQSCSEAFSSDTDLVKEARKKYFSKHSYNFTMEGTHDLLEVFRQMAESAELLGTSIYQIQALWTGLVELRQANYALRSLPKGLKFLHAVPLSESPKVMGLVGIHDPDALCHFNSITHCPWCRRRARMRGQ